MIDAITKEPIEVLTDGIAGPYIMVALEQLEVITKALDAQDVHYWVDEDVISIDGEPEVATINLSRNADIRQAQNLLDRI